MLGDDHEMMVTTISIYTIPYIQFLLSYLTNRKISRVADVMQ